MDIAMSFVSNAQPAETVQPSERSFANPAQLPKALTDSTPCRAIRGATPRLRSQIR